MTMSLSAELWPDVQPEAARRLMLAGVESFARRGYHATTTRDIAGGAGKAAYVFHATSGVLTVEDFSLKRLTRLKPADIADRYAAFHDLIRLEP